MGTLHFQESVSRGKFLRLTPENCWLFINYCSVISDELNIVSVLQKHVSHGEEKSRL